MADIFKGRVAKMRDRTKDPFSKFNEDRRKILKGTLALGVGVLLPPQLANSALKQSGSDTQVIGGAKALSSSPVFPIRPLMKANLKNSLDFKCLSKPVYETLIIDDMERDGKWTASDVVQMEYTTDRAKVGTRSLRFRTNQRNEEYIKQSRQKNGSFIGSGVLFSMQPFSAGMTLSIDPPQDWSRFNRISIWCYLHPTENPITSLSLQFLCDGATSGPMDPVAVHYISNLKSGQWNRLVWEISEYQRDKVSEFVLFQSLSGVPKKGFDPILIYDFDQLQLERVDVEPVEGWAVSPGKISFSHIGYQPAAVKLAFSGDLAARDFQLLDAVSGAAVANLPTKMVENRRGRFQVLDFSAFTKPGRYWLRCGSSIGDEFPISEDAWRSITDKTLNSFYGMRCGFAVPDMHDACHLDVLVSYKGEKRVAGGGWHDAANLTQGAGRTHLSIFALLQLYEQLKQREIEPELAERVLEEARWGLEWSMRMRFGKGLRCNYMNSSYYTDSEIDTIDDVVQENVGFDPFQHTLAALATGYAARILKPFDPEYSATLLKAAEEDYESALEAYPEPPSDSPPIYINQGSWRDRVAYLTHTAVELYRATGRKRYADDAARLGRWLLQVQEQRFVDGIPITGYFYEDANRTRIVHEYHNSFGECGLFAFKALCEAFPDHQDWIEWYAGLLINSEFYCRQGVAASSPYDVIPCSVWRRSDIDAPLPVDQHSFGDKPNPVHPTKPTDELIRNQMLKMFDDGAYLGENYRLRVFPLWHNSIQHGASVVHLSKTAGLMAAAQVRNRRDLAELAARQVQWVLGANPFSRSIIYGEGYDYWQNFTVSLPSIVGGMSLGLNSYHGDSPAWPNNALFPYKEQWIFSNCRMMLNLAQVGIPARVSGSTTSGATFIEKRTGKSVRVDKGNFDLNLAAGEYTITYGDTIRQMALVDGKIYQLELDPRKAIEMELSATTPSGGLVKITANLHGTGAHTLELRTFNATVEQKQLKLDLGSNGKRTLDWTLRITDPEKPWVMVVIPDGRMADLRELFGTTQNLQKVA
jgi:hypothetical protein